MPDLTDPIALVADEVAASEAILAAVAERLGTPDRPYVTYEGHPLAALAEALGVTSATIAALVLERERDEYAAFGANVLELPRRAAQVAGTIATFTLSANTGGTIPAGFELALENPQDGDAYAFATTQDAVVAPGGAVAADVPVAALDAGPEPNGSVGVPVARDDLELPGGVTVAQVEVLVPASGGSAEETLEEYAPKVRDRARRVRALPITPEDHAALALDVPGVARAYAINRRASVAGADAGTDAPGQVLVLAVDAAGNPVAAETVTALQAYLTGTETVRGTVANAAAPGAVDVTAVVQFVRDRRYGAADAEAAVEAQVLARLARGAWNRDDATPGRFLPADRRRDRLTVYDVAAAVDDMAQVAAVRTVTIAAGAGTQGTGDVLVPATSVGAVTAVTATAV